MISVSLHRQKCQQLQAAAENLRNIATKCNSAIESAQSMGTSNCATNTIENLEVIKSGCNSIANSISAYGNAMVSAAESIYNEELRALEEARKKLEEAKKND